MYNPAPLAVASEAVEAMLMPAELAIGCGGIVGGWACACGCEASVGWNAGALGLGGAL